MTSSVPVRSIARAMSVLRSLNLRPVSRLADLQADTGLPPPTLVRLLDTLVELGYVAKLGRRAGYALEEKVVELSSGYHGLPQFIDCARPVLSDLTRRVLWPAALATLEGLYMVVRLSTIPDSPLAHTQSTLQKRLSLMTRAHGRAYLAYSRPEVRRRLFAQLSAAAISHSDAQALEEHMEPVLAQVRRVGYAERAHEIDPDTTTLAVPIMNGEDVAATIGVTLFKGARSEKGLLTAELRNAARQVERIISA